MSVFRHFFWSNLKHNRLELFILYLLLFIVLGTVELINSLYGEQIAKIDQLNLSQLYTSLAFYSLLYVFYTNKRKNHVKFLLTLPLNNLKLIFFKACSDIVFFIPTMALVFKALSHSDFEYHFLLTATALIQVSLIISLYLVDSSIEEPRLENAKASFLNKIVYIRKAIDIVLFILLAVSIIALIKILPIALTSKFYMGNIFISFFIILKLRHSLNLLNDESLSYFLPKRDLVRSGWKLGLMAIPVVIAVTNYLNRYNVVSKDLDKLIKTASSETIIETLEKNNLLTTEELTEKNILFVSVHHERLDLLKELHENGIVFDLSHHYQLKTDSPKEHKSSLLDVVAESGNTEVFDFLVRNGTNLENLFVADQKNFFHRIVSRCNMDLFDLTVNNEGFQQFYQGQDEEGNTPLHLAAQARCDYITLTLLDQGVEATTKNKEEHTFDHYLYNRKIKRYIERKIATEVEKQESE